MSWLGRPSKKRESDIWFLFQRALHLDSWLSLSIVPGLVVSAPQVWGHHVIWPDQSCGSGCSPAPRELPGGEEAQSLGFASAHISLLRIIVFTAETITRSCISRWFWILANPWLSVFISSHSSPGEIRTSEINPTTKHPKTGCLEKPSRYPNSD